MATIQRRKHKQGYSYQVLIRAQDGHPPAYKSFPSKQEARDWAKDEEARRRQATYFPDQSQRKHILADLIDRYLSDILPSKPKNATDTKRHLIYLKEKLGSHTLNLITYDLIHNLRKELAQGLTPKGTPRNPATVNRYMAAFSVVFTYGFKQLGWLKENPFLRLNKLRESKGRDRLPTTDELKRLFDSCRLSKNKHLHHIVLLAITTGMRQGEILNLTWDCVDLDYRCLHLKDTKNTLPRSVPLIAQTIQFFQELSQTKPPHQQLVFYGRSRFAKTSIRKAWEEALRRANIANLRFHDLRHLFCTLAAQSASNTTQLAVATGHQSLQMLRRYTHQDANHTRILSESVAAKLFKQGISNDE